MQQWFIVSKGMTLENKYQFSQILKSELKTNDNPGIL